MKKLNLDAAFEKGEVLTRSQLKKVLGGVGPCDHECDVDADCPSDLVCIYHGVYQCPNKRRGCYMPE